MKPKFGLTKEEVQVILASGTRLSDALRILMYMDDQKDGATCDECCLALRIKVNSGSTTISRLVKAGCVEYTGITRRTSSRGYAKVCKAYPGADFRAFIAKKNSVVRGKSTDIDRAILESGRYFVSKWCKATTRGQKSKLIEKLVSELTSTCGNPSSGA